MRTDYAHQIREMVPAIKAAEMYGLEVNRAGFVSCPFHSGDRTASLKLYEDAGGFHCFGCGAHGSVVDLVMELFGLSFRSACEKLNADFSLGLPIGRTPGFFESQRAVRNRHKHLEERTALQDFLTYLSTAESIWFRCDDWRRRYRPETPFDDIDERYAFALKTQDYAAYLLDGLLEPVKGVCPWGGVTK